LPWKTRHHPQRLCPRQPLQMGPGLDCPGKRRKSTSPTTVCVSLQWGQGWIALENTGGGSATVVNGLCFNGARAGLPWKTPSLCGPVALGDRASMGPGLDCPGKPHGSNTA